MKKFMGLTIAVLTIATLAGCGTKAAATAPVNNTTAPVQTVSDKDQAANVVKEYLAAEGSYNYKDSASFRKPTQYMVPDVATAWLKDQANVPASFTKLNAVGSPVGTVTVNYKGQKGSAYAFEGIMKASAINQVTKKSAGDITFDEYVEVTKQSNGTFLITYVTDEKNLK